MNLHRYKVNLSLPGSGETNYEFVGTWIGFAGMLLFIIHVATGDVREAFKIVPIVVGVTYGLYWFATQHKTFLYVLAFICELLFFALWLYRSEPSCELYINLTCVTCCPEDKWQLVKSCSVSGIGHKVYASYFGSVFLAAFYYLWRGDGKAI